MILKDIVLEDFSNYKEPSMFLICPYCSFKCDIENGNKVCQNSELVKLENKNISNENIIKSYLNNNISKAIVLGGLEPFDSQDIKQFIEDFREKSNDKIIIYTGYTEKEVIDRFNWILDYHNLIIKYGRYIPNRNKIYDETLCMYLASDNQYAKEID